MGHFHLPSPLQGGLRHHINCCPVPLFSILSLRNTSLITTSFQVQYSNKSLLCCPFTVLTVLTVYRAVQQMKRRKVVGQILWWLKTVSTIYILSKIMLSTFWRGCVACSVTTLIIHPLPYSYSWGNIHYTIYPYPASTVEVMYCDFHPNHTFCVHTMH